MTHLGSCLIVTWEGSCDVINKFKSSMAKLLTLSGVTTCLNPWKFVSFLFQSLTFLENICSKSNFPAAIYRFKVKLMKSCFADIAYVCIKRGICFSQPLALSPPNFIITVSRNRLL